MRLASHILATTDGLDSWRAVFRSVQRHMEGQQELIPLILIGLLVIGVLIGNYFVARWLTRPNSKPRAHAPRSNHPTG